MRFRVEEDKENSDTYKQEQQPPVIKDIGENGVCWIGDQLKKFYAAATGFNFKEFEVDEIEEYHEHTTQYEKETRNGVEGIRVIFKGQNAKEVERDQEVDHGLYIKQDTPEEDQGKLRERSAIQVGIKVKNKQNTAGSQQGKG